MYAQTDAMLNSGNGTACASRSPNELTKKKKKNERTFTTFTNVIMQKKYENRPFRWFPE